MHDDTRRSDPGDATGAPQSKRQRIAKLMARAGLCSRRDAEAWVIAGRVSVNDVLLSSPAIDVAPEDRILVDGVPLPALEKTRLFLFHKPRGLVTSDHDPEGRATVIDYLREHWPDGPRIVTVGRLDINTEGLLLLTNDGGLSRVLELPQTGWVRRYRVRAKGTVDPAALDALAEGISIDGIDYAGIEAKLDRVQGANVWLTMGLREGKNREIKRVLEHMALEVNRLIRLSFGPFQLLDLPEGAVEEVRTRVLRDQLGAKLAAQAGADLGDAPRVAEVKATTGKPRAAAGRHGDPAVRRDAKPARAERGTRTAAPRPGDRHDRRREPRAEPAPVRERPARGTRKHVSTLRAERADATGDTSRTRIERSDTLDRRNRPVAVERLVRPQTDAASARKPRFSRGEPRPDEKPHEGRRPRSVDGALDDRQRRPRAASSEREARDRRHSDGPIRSAGLRRHASPSAEGKRERIARSGPRRDDGGADQGARRGPSGAKRSFSNGPKRPPSDRKPDRSTHRANRSAKAETAPAQARSPRRDARSDRTSRGEDRGPGASRDRRPPQSDRPRGKPSGGGPSRGRPSSDRTGGKPTGGGRRGPSKPKR